MWVVIHIWLACHGLEDGLDCFIREVICTQFHYSNVCYIFGHILKLFIIEIDKKGIEIVYHLMEVGCPYFNHRKRIENAVQVITSAHSLNGSWLGHDLMPMSKGLFEIGHILTWVWPPPLWKMFKNCNIGTARHPLSRPHRRLECSKEEIFYEKIVSTDSFAEF